jgi:hypothetical protein
MDTGERFARAIAAKDAQGLANVLDPQVDFRALTPNRAWEAGDADAVVEIVLGSWFEPKDELEELVDVRTGRLADRQSVVYRLRGRNPDGPFVVEQDAFLSEGDGGIEWLRVLCSGFRPSESD